MSDRFIQFCNLAKQEIDLVLNQIDLNQKSGTDFINTKSGASPVVTEIDLQIEARLRQLINDHFPKAGILGEEFAEKIINDSDQRFILDPIDGTIALVTGKPTFTSLIALEQAGEFHSGWIYLPVLDQVFLATKGHGATGPRGPLRTSQKTNWSQLVWSTTSPAMFPEAWHKQLLNRLHELCWLSSYGGDAMQYCLLAEGRIDIVIENQMAVYDYASLVPIVEESGGCISDFQGRPLRADSCGEVLATANQSIHENMLNLIAETRNFC